LKIRRGGESPARRRSSNPVDMTTRWKDDDMRVFLLVAVTLLFIALGALEVVASRAVLPLP